MVRQIISSTRRLLLIENKTKGVAQEKPPPRLNRALL